MEETENLNGSAAPKIEKIDSIIRESLAENEKLPSPSRQPHSSPRGRGRPRRGNAPNKATIEKMQSQFQGTSTGAPENAIPHSPQPNLNSTPGESGGPQAVVELPASAIKAILQIPFNFARAKTGFDGFQLDDPTADACVPLANECIKIYFPDTDSKHAPLIALCATLGSVALNQSMEFQEWKRKNAVASVNFQKTQIVPVQEITQ